MREKRPKAVSVEVHCNRMAMFVGGQMPWEVPPESGPEEKDLSSSTVFDWLRVAASIESVSVNTVRFGEGVMYDSGILDYEAKRSNILSELLMDQIRFNYVWGAFETLAKIKQPPPVPKEVKPRASMVDRIAFRLKSAFDHRRIPVSGYGYWLGRLINMLSRRHGLNISLHTRFTKCAGHAGLGISVVRHIRNQFAHGIVNLPEPKEWTGQRPVESEVIKLSTRLVLLTMQMLLLADCSDPYWGSPIIPDFNTTSLWSNIDWRAAAILHLEPDDEVAPLFNGMEVRKEGNE